jgi:hypothetical protein
LTQFPMSAIPQVGHELADSRRRRAAALPYRSLGRNSSSREHQSLA